MGNKKIFTTATTNKQSMSFYIFLLIPLILLHWFSGIEPKYVAKDIILFIILYFLYSKILVTKITTDSLGISYYSFFKKVRASWNEVISIKQSPYTHLFKVKTHKGEFSFPLTIREKDVIYPKLKVRWTGEEAKWVYENGIEKTATLENCPLYIEIQKYANLSDEQISIIKGKESKLKTASKKPFYIGLFVFLIFIVLIYQVMLSQGYSDKSANSVLYSLIFIFIIVAVFVLLGTYQKK